ncbi:Carboxylic ester hydrolase, partial [Gryllus bimaculatus]
PAATARRLARLLGCTSDDPHAIVDFLRTVDHMELVRMARTEAVPEKDKERLVKCSFVPTPELVVPGVETFLPASVEQLMKEGRHHDVPYMSGYLLSDLSFSEGVMYALRCIAQKSTAPVYQYVFGVEDELNATKKFLKIDLPGACHGDEMGYLFDLGYVQLNAPKDSPAALTRRRLVRLLTNFAKNGDPTPEKDPVLDVRWKPYTTDEKNFLNIGNQLQNSTDLSANRADAQPPESWEGVRDAFEEGDCCAQFNFMKNKFEGSDDCLFMNVYTRHLPARRDDPLPVMVFIHGGGFEVGSGEKDYCGPDYLVAEDVIMVSFNYRVGVLGLFHRAIAMSGAALNPWAHQTEPAATARRLARLLGCTSDDPHAIVDFLRTVDHMELVRMARTEAVPEKDKERLVKFSFVPTPEIVVPGVETFLPAPVEQMMKEGRNHDVPYMSGFASQECLMVVLFRDFRNETIARELDGKWRQSILTELRIPSEGPNVDAALHELRQFFMNGKPLSEDTINGFITLLSDLSFSEGVMCALRCIANKSTAPVYQYVFSAEDQLNAMKKYLKIDLPGACHGDDMGYLFDLGFVQLDAPEDSSAARTRQRLVRLLTNFAKSGNPTPENDSLLGACWKPYTKDERNYLEIGNQLRSDTNLFADRVAFWETFYEKYGS